ncbi:beta-ketoacyl-[acyl-carrier-protein] synthase family protein [Gaiella sp.]|uniref:beta-ketoacyl-[acyl-carrier-protein] synthase family protein n=1 Tax=Gaiella sp. TaxID=2663207 RepID=UPI003983269B
MTLRDVVITGVGAVTPLGVGARTLHERWTSGACGIRDGEAPCADFDPTDHMSVKQARRADRSTQLAIAAGDEALAEAGWADELPYDPEWIGCVLGTGIGGIGTLEDNHDLLRDTGAESVSPLAIPLMMSNAGSAALSLRHGLRGPVFSVVSACAAGSHAIGTALRMIQHGEAEAMVTGAAEAPLTPLSRAAFGSMGAISPTGMSRPFDNRRDGFVMGEGAGVLVLEAGDAARARGANILGTVRGYGASGDAHHITAPHAEGRGGARAMQIALNDAGIEALGVDYVNAHGTSTQLNDRAETMALKSVLGDRAREVPISSTKSAIGHLLGAAGAVEAVATILALRDRIAPPTIGWEEPEEGMDLNYVPGTARALKMSNGRPPVALSNSFGFGGHNASLCLEAA